MAPSDLWQQLSVEQRQQVIAILVQLLLRQLLSKAAEVNDERGE